MIVPDALTPLTHDDLIAALRDGYVVTFGRAALPGELAVYYGQCILENGARLQAVHCFNLGNVKATATWAGDVCAYACDETVDAATARVVAAFGPCECHPQAAGRVRLVLTPPHPWCNFRAFGSAGAGAAAYLALFAWRRYAQAALRARAGDAAGFVAAAHAGGYFTAPDVGAYQRAVASIAAHALDACRAALAPTAGTVPPALDVDAIMGLVALTAAGTAHGEEGAPP